MSKEAFAPSGQVDPIRPQQNLCLEDSFMIIKNKVLVEVPVSEPGVDVLALPVFSSISLHYWEN